MKGNKTCAHEGVSLLLVKKGKKVFKKPIKEKTKQKQKAAEDVAVWKCLERTCIEK